MGQEDTSVARIAAMTWWWRHCWLLQWEAGQCSSKGSAAQSSGAGGKWEMPIVQGGEAAKRKKRVVHQAHLLCLLCLLGAGPDARPGGQRPANPGAFTLFQADPLLLPLSHLTRGVAPELLGTRHLAGFQQTRQPSRRPRKVDAPSSPASAFRRDPLTRGAAGAPASRPAEEPVTLLASLRRAFGLLMRAVRRRQAASSQGKERPDFLVGVFEPSCNLHDARTHAEAS
ncbi:hypothetical protein WJX72_009463 [[Myrmecia] bisecta]|uniref:Uncharacterized protein n=1 Tax=[Myrmecia] bisecta TaxID=41462 RepID=A0AAW1PPK2_9CHLO